MEDKDTRASLQSWDGIALVVALAVVVLIAFLSYRAWTALSNQTDHVQVSQQIVHQTNALTSSLKDAETGQRGFLLTGESRYLEPYKRAAADIPKLLESLRKTAVTRPHQTQRIARLQPLVEAKLAELQQTIDLRQARDLDAALTVVRTDRGKNLMDQIRSLCAEIQDGSEKRVLEYSEQARASANRLELIATFGSGGLFVLLVLATATIQTGTRRRQNLIRRLRQAEREANESRDWLQTTLRSIGDGVIATDALGRVTFLNATAQGLTGWKQEDAAGKPLDEMFLINNEETGATVENPAHRALREGRVVGLANHTKLTARDGRQLSIDDSAAPIRDEEGTVKGVVLVFRDVSERKHAEQAIRESEARFRQLAENMPQVVWTADPAGVLDYVNARWTELTGCDLEQTRAGEFEKNMPGEDVQTMRSAWSEGLQNITPFSFECRFPCQADNSLRWYLVRSLPVRNENGEVVKWLGTSTDIDDQKRAEEQIRFRAEELEAFLDATPAFIWISRDSNCSVITGNRAANELVGVARGANVSASSDDPDAVAATLSQFKPDGTPYRPEELPLQRAVELRRSVAAEIEFRLPDGRRIHTVGNAAPLFDVARNVRGCVGAFVDITEYKRTQQALLRANEDLRQFAYAASHDLQEPLRMIASYSQLLLRGFRGELDGDAALFVNFIKEGTDRMRDLLADLLAYTQVDEDGPEPPERVDLNPVFREAVENLRTAIDESQAVVTSDDLPMVRGSAARFLQVFQNLIGNAIKYRGERAPQIHVSAEAMDGGWRLAVSDNGIGIDPQYHAQIFGVFKRLHGRGIPGTGIGLAICQRVVERYGGRIWVESAAGQGATFYFMLQA